MKWTSFLFVSLLLSCTTMSGSRSVSGKVRFHKTTSKAFTFCGRFKRQDGGMLSYAPGAYFRVGFEGSSIELEVDDEKRFGAHNYIHVIIDDTIEKRFKLEAHQNIITLAKNLPPGRHTLLVVKDTESAMGFLNFRGVSCEKVCRLPGKPRRIEFIGDSITCGNGSDTTGIKCSEGTWYDQHNAFAAFGPLTARNLDAEWILSSVSGIGMTRSCCGLSITMPEVYSRFNLSESGEAWSFRGPKPDVVVITLGQNDGIVDSLIYCRKYVSFAQTVRKIYPAATIVCCSSPMADAKLMDQMSRFIPAIEAQLHLMGDLNVRSFLYKKNYRSGCFFHPTVSQHKEISDELLPFLKVVMGV